MNLKQLISEPEYKSLNQFFNDIDQYKNFYVYTVEKNKQKNIYLVDLRNNYNHEDYALFDISNTECVGDCCNLSDRWTNFLSSLNNQETMTF